MLREYRERTRVAAKLVVVARASDGLTIADPDDAGTLDLVGVDTATPQVLHAFMSSRVGNVGCPAGSLTPRARRARSGGTRRAPATRHS